MAHRRPSPSLRLAALAALASLTALVVGCGQEGNAGSAADQGTPAQKTEKKAESHPAVAALGEMAPDFALADLEGNTHRLSDYTKAGKVVILEWFNPDCPFVKKHHMKTKSMAETSAHAAKHGVVWLAINSGGPGKQGHGLERNQKAMKDYGIQYPVLIDENGEVGKKYKAKTTPHMFVISEKGVLVYDGAIDNKPNPSELGDINYINQCLDEHVNGKAVSTNTTKPYGCSVKYAS